MEENTKKAQLQDQDLDQETVASEEELTSEELDEVSGGLLPAVSSQVNQAGEKLQYPTGGGFREYPTGGGFRK